MRNERSIKNKMPIIGEDLLEQFSVGDLVSWKRLVQDKTGIVLEIFIAEASSRQFPFAKVYIMGEDRRDNVLLSNLTNLSRVQD